MTPITLSASSALAGSIVGALASVLSSYVMPSGATHRDLLARNIAERQALYAKFIKHAARVYAKALTSNAGELDETIHLYGLISRMRLVATNPVVQAAEDAVHAVVSQYDENNLSMDQLQILIREPMRDPSANFSTACRTELRGLMTVAGRRRPLDF